jgi:ATP-dependent RNA helicase RhlE
MTFNSLGLSSPLLDAITQQGYVAPYPIQLESIPAVLKGKDILGIAPTGSGKTAGYVLPILEKLIHHSPSQNRYVHTLVLVPTRELAIQVNEVFKTLGSFLTKRIKTMAVYGGVSINPQMIGLSGVEVLVATPGRLLELVESKAVHLSEIKILVLDEADKMLNMGFKEEMNKIFSLLPAMRQNLLFSATLSPEVTNIHDRLLNHPLIIQPETTDENIIDLISQTAYHVTEERKGPLLRYLIKHYEMKQVLVFTSSVHKADAVVVKLKLNGIDAMAMHSKKSQGARTDAFTKFKNGKLRVLVATDLMSRGIDIKFLPYVINYELPRSPKDYIHRIGRTGRAESPGEAISLISPDEKHHFIVIQKKLKKFPTIIESDDLDLHGY